MSFGFTVQDEEWMQSTKEEFKLRNIMSLPSPSKMMQSTKEEFKHKSNLIGLSIEFHDAIYQRGI